MKLPKHIKPDDYSSKARDQRMDHCVEMSMLNPSGFREPTSKAGDTKGYRRYKGGSLVARRCREAGVV